MFRTHDISCGWSRLIVEGKRKRGGRKGKEGGDGDQTRGTTYRAALVVHLMILVVLAVLVLALAAKVIADNLDIELELAVGVRRSVILDREPHATISIACAKDLNIRRDVSFN